MFAKVIAVLLAVGMTAAMAAITAAWAGVLPAGVGAAGLMALGGLVPVALLVTVVAVTRRR